MPPPPPRRRPTQRTTRPATRRIPGRAVARRPATGDHRVRVGVMRFVLVAALVAAGLKLVQVQGFESDQLASAAERQRTTTIDIPAKRGSIVDRNGVQLAFSVESRTLAFRPKATRKERDELQQKRPDATATFDARTADIAKYLRQVLGDKVDEQDLVTRMRSDSSFIYLIKDLDPATARDITTKFPEIISETRALREYPGGSLASNIVGVANWRMDDPSAKKHNLHGLSGLESARDNDLAGTPGSQVVDTAEGGDGVVIPGTERNVQAATDGSDLELTIDSDLQFDLQQRLGEYVVRSGAKRGSAVIMDAHTGEVYALATNTSFDPNATGTFDIADMGNAAVSDPYEPGSVNKIVTAMSTIEYGVSTPDKVMQVPGSIKVADRTVHDAWSHGTLPLTTTGVFAKSSNVGTLMLAQQIGPDRYSDMLQKLGIGQRTGVGLPGESPGSVPPRGQWSGSTFGNLPIGQGLSMTVLQMAGMYQTIANDGVRVPPRIVKAEIRPDGTRVPEAAPPSVPVVSKETAVTTRNMLRAVVQQAPNQNSGTGSAAALSGYQVSGKTGTAQQVNPATGTYSNSLYWITFAGILPADNPRFVVGIMLDKPIYSLPSGHSAAPLFHEIASFLAQRYSIPLSKEPSPVVPLIAP